MNTHRMTPRQRLAIRQVWKAEAHTMPLPRGVANQLVRRGIVERLSFMDDYERVEWNRVIERQPYVRMMPEAYEVARSTTSCDEGLPE